MTTPTNSSLTKSDQQHYLPTFKRFPLAFEKGRGMYLYDVEGKKYLDFLAGIAVVNVGHCHPDVTIAIEEQADKLVHISNFFVSQPQVDLAQKLTQISSLPRVFFTNSGAESVEGAIKIARKYASTKKRGGKIISMEGSFHGRTLATIATGQEKYQKGFEPIPSGFEQVPFNDLAALKKKIGKDTAAVILEPIQGEGGVRPADTTCLNEVRKLCDEKDVLLIFDEVQCGMGRTGHWFAKDAYHVQPDIMTLAKGMGNGMPVGAFLCSQKVADAIDFGDHGTTFGGNPLACRAALATIEVIENENLLENAELMGSKLRQGLQQLSVKYKSHVLEVRGMGLMLGMEFKEPAGPLVKALLEEGIIANATADNVLRLVPPLIVEETHINTLVAALDELIHKTLIAK